MKKKCKKVFFFQKAADCKTKTHHFPKFPNTTEAVITTSLSSLTRLKEWYQPNPELNTTPAALKKKTFFHFSSTPDFLDEFVF